VNPYDREFFRRLTNGASRSAEIIVPLVIDLVNPQSVIDIGCGTGTWLAVFNDFGVADILGVDGPWVQEEALVVPQSCFLACDLTKSIDISRVFDLAVCLEVAEHLDEKYARNLVATLVQLSPVVLFSAAIPFQQGTSHLNEQWPEYWAQLFQERRYVAIDCIRDAIWNNEEVDWWYAQNILIFAKERHVLMDPKLRSSMDQTSLSQLSLVHPKNYLRVATQGIDIGLKSALQLLPRLTINAIKNRLKRNMRSSALKPRQR
jgi:SAM-dependent methyltransferase